MPRWPIGRHRLRRPHPGLRAASGRDAHGEGPPKPAVTTCLWEMALTAAIDLVSEPPLRHASPAVTWTRWRLKADSWLDKAPAAARSRWHDARPPRAGRLAGSGGPAGRDCPALPRALAHPSHTGRGGPFPSGSSDSPGDELRLTLRHCGLLGHCAHPAMKGCVCFARKGGAGALGCDVSLAGPALCGAVIHPATER